MLNEPLAMLQAVIYEIEEKAGIQKQAEMLVNAIDPCVQYAIEINEAITG